MSEIPKYLEDNPNYYIKGGDKVASINSNVKDNVISILDGFKIENCTIPPLYPGFKLKKEGNDIGYISYRVEDNTLKIVYVKINDGNNEFRTFNNNNNYQGQGYGKKLYLGVAIEAKKRGLTLISDYTQDIKDKAKFIWNKFINDGLAEYVNNRFRFINERLP